MKKTEGNNAPLSRPTLKNEKMQKRFCFDRRDDSPDVSEKKKNIRTEGKKKSGKKRKQVRRSDQVWDRESILTNSSGKTGWRVTRAANAPPSRKGERLRGQKSRRKFNRKKKKGKMLKWDKTQKKEERHVYGLRKKSLWGGEG